MECLSRKEPELVVELFVDRTSKLCKTTMLMLLQEQMQIVVPVLQLVYSFLQCIVKLLER